MAFTYQEFSDQALISQYISAQCDRSLTELMRRHKDGIYSTIYLLVRDHHVAEDIFQEVWIKIINNIRAGKYTHQGKFMPWAARISHNLCIDHFRKIKAPRRATHHNTFEIEEDRSLTTTQCPESLLEAAQTKEALWELMQLLPEEQLEVLVMRVYGEMSFKQISNAMGVSVNTSLGRMRYGLLNIRKMINARDLVLR